MTAAVTQSRLSKLSALTGHVIDTASYKLAPIAGLYPAAYWSYIHMTAHMGVDDVNAKVISASIEIVGIVSVNTAVRALERGRNGLSFAAFAAFLMYVGIVVLLNFIVSAANALGPNWLVWAAILAAALMALMGVPSAIIIMVESQLHAHDRKIVALADEKAGDAATLFDQQERAKDNASRRKMEEMKERAALKVAKVQESTPKVSKTEETYPKDIRKLTKAQKDKLSILTPEEIAAKVGVSLKSGQNWKKAFEKDGAEAVTK